MAGPVLGRIAEDKDCVVEITSGLSVEGRICSVLTFETSESEVVCRKVD